MSFPIIIIKGRPTDLIDTITTQAVSGTHTIIDMDTIHTPTAIIGTPTPIMAITCGLGSLSRIQEKNGIKRQGLSIASYF